MLTEEFQALPLEDGLWMIDDGICHCYLAVGTQRALLLDTGIGKGDILAAVRKVTDKPLTLVISHEHLDHLGGIRAFSEACVHGLEAHAIPEGIGRRIIKEGELFDLGGTVLEVLELPGHSIGSVGLIERGRGYILTGDLLEADKILLHCATSDPAQYYKTLGKLLSLREVKTIYPSHLEYPLTMQYAQSVYDCVGEYLSGRLETTPLHLVIPGKELDVHQFSYKGVSITVK